MRPRIVWPLSVAGAVFFTLESDSWATTGVCFAPGGRPPEDAFSHETPHLFEPLHEDRYAWESEMAPRERR